MRKWTRRAFIGAGSLVGGGFVLGVAGVAFAPGRHGVVSDDAADKGELTTWITVTPDNFATILVPHCEMGQGSQTGLAMMAAEEMEAEWDRVRIEEAPALDAYANAYMLRAFTGDSMPAPLGRAMDYGAYRLARWFGTQATGGSLAVRGTGYGMRVAGAAAREMLIAAAAERFGVPAAECTAARSRVTHAPSARSASFGELAQAAAAIPVPSNPTLNDPDTYTIRRTAKPRFDIPPKVDGGVRYGIDFTLPGMLYAAVDIAPVQGGKLISVDPAPARALPGVRRVVELEDAVAVVADSYWRARKAVAAISPVYDDAGHGEVSSTSIFAAFDEALGAVPKMPAEAARVITADYRVPFLAHATMEPMACTARVEGDRAEVWAGTQDPLNARSIAAGALDLDANQVQLTNLMLGGGYGRRLPFCFDYVDLGAGAVPVRVRSRSSAGLRWTRGRLWHPRRQHRPLRTGLASGDRCKGRRFGARRMYVAGILSSQPSQVCLPSHGTVPERRANVQKGARLSGRRPKVFGAVTRLGWLPKRRRYALACLMSLPKWPLGRRIRGQKSP